MTQKAGRRWPVGRRTLAVATGQCARTTLARVVRGSAKAGAEMQTARILNVSPPTWTYKACALFALQSIYLSSECGFGVSLIRLSPSPLSCFLYESASIFAWGKKPVSTSRRVSSVTHRYAAIAPDARAFLRVWERGSYAATEA